MSNCIQILSRFERVLVKFDDYYPHGEAHDTFIELAKTTTHTDEVIISHVGVKGQLHLELNAGLLWLY